MDYEGKVLAYSPMPAEEEKKQKQQIEGTFFTYKISYKIF
jgi:hypothetical protein